MVSGLPSSIPDWESAPLSGRRSTFLRALRRLHQLVPQGAYILETGTVRGDCPSARAGDGWSTLIWGWYARHVGGHVWTVDADPEAVATCRKVTHEHAPWITYVAGDSVAFLQSGSPAHGRKIDLLYLDSLDYEDAPASESHHLAEARAALPILASQCLVLFDDSEFCSETAIAMGKGALAIPFLLAHGFSVEWSDGRQVLLSRGCDATIPETDSIRGPVRLRMGVRR